MSKPFDLSLLGKPDSAIYSAFVDSWQGCPLQEKWDTVHEYGLTWLPSEEVDVLVDHLGDRIAIPVKKKEDVKMDFSKPADRRKFRDEWHKARVKDPGETASAVHSRLDQILEKYDVNVSASLKTFWDANGNSNRDPQPEFPQAWPKAHDYSWHLKYARPKRLGKPKPKPGGGTKPVQKRQAEPQPKPSKTLGWDDFDWSR